MIMTSSMGSLDAVAAAAYEAYQAACGDAVRSYPYLDPAVKAKAERRYPDSAQRWRVILSPQMAALEYALVQAEIMPPNPHAGHHG